jgi:hypothetical protein
MDIAGCFSKGSHENEKDKAEYKDLKNLQFG